MLIFSEIQQTCPECNSLPTNHKCIKFRIACLCPEFLWKWGHNDLNEISWKDCDYFEKHYSDNNDEKTEIDTEENNITEVDNNNNNNKNNEEEEKN